MLQSDLHENLPGRIAVCDLGLAEYGAVWKTQLEFVAKRAAGEVGDILFLVEHPAVFTLGKKSPELKSEIPEQIGGIPVHVAERGGEITYHGPGQLVAYPVFQVDRQAGARGFLRVLEKTLLDALDAFDVRGFLIEGATGVWVYDGQKSARKIASIGIAVRKGVAYHGIALNVQANLKHFDLISPCGFAPDVMINLADIVDGVDVERVKPVMATMFKKNFS